jgi:hypothetical protein
MGSAVQSILNVFTVARAFPIDETMLQIGSNNGAWLWVAMEPIHKQILGVYVSRHKEYDNCRERHLFLSSLIRIMVINIPFIAMVEHGILKHVPR